MDKLYCSLLNFCSFIYFVASINGPELSVIPSLSTNLLHRHAREAGQTEIPVNCPMKCVADFASNMNMTNMLKLDPTQLVASDKPDMLEKSCKKGYNPLKACLSACPSGEDVDTTNLGMSSMDYVCGERYEKFVSSYSCAYNTTQEAIKKECQKPYNQTVDIVKDFLGKIKEGERPPTVDDSFSMTNSLCELSFQMVACYDPLMTKNCGKDVAELYRGLYAVVGDSLVQTFDSLSNLTSRLGANSVIKVPETPAKCVEFRDKVRGMGTDAEKSDATVGAGVERQGNELNNEETTVPSETTPKAGGGLTQKASQMTVAGLAGILMAVILSSN